jgi:hypothetical protein
MRIADELLDGDGRIDEGKWTTARALEEPVGRCHWPVRDHVGEQVRDCGAAMYALASDGAFGRRFHNVACRAGHEAVIPATRVVRAPTRLVGVGVVSDVLMDAARERDAAILGERG